MICCGIDIGTNTVRMTIAEVNPQGKIDKVLYSDRAITRLGGGLYKTGQLSQDGIDRSIAALKDFKVHIDKYNVSKVSAVATSAVREASNSKVFLDMADELGVQVKVISAMEEAHYTYTGIISGLKQKFHEMVFYDIGGGSTEIMYVHERALSSYGSIPLGVVKLSEKFSLNRPVGKDVIDACAVEVRESISQMFEGNSIYPQLVVGTAGSVTTMAAMDLGIDKYDYRLISGHVLNEKNIENMIDKLAPLTSVEKLRLPGVTKGREDLVLCSAVMVREILRYFNVQSCSVSEYGLMEGIIIASVH